MKRALQRLREPSTYAGLAGLAILAGQHEAAASIHALGVALPDALGALFALVAVMTGERAKP